MYEFEREVVDTTEDSDEAFSSESASSSSQSLTLSHEAQQALNNALCIAAHKGELDKVKSLLEQGANPNAQVQVQVTVPANSKNPMELGYKPSMAIPVSMLAAKSGHGLIVQTLVAEGADVNTLVSTAASPTVDPALSQLSLLTCALDHSELFQWLLTVVSPAIKTHMLHFMVQRASVLDMVQLAIRLAEMKASGTNLDAPNVSGATALMTATINGHLFTALTLLKLGANPNVPDPRGGQTPLPSAIMCNNVGMIEILIQGGANVNIRTQLGSTPLHLIAGMPVDTATANGETIETMSIADQCEVATLLLDKGADINAPLTEDGVTPLMLAVQGQKYELVKLLLERDAQINLQDSEGYNALDYCLMCSNTDARILNLLCKQAKTDIKLFIEAILVAAQAPNQTNLDGMLAHRIDDGIQPTLKYLAAAKRLDLLAALCMGDRETVENALLQMMQSIAERKHIDSTLYDAVHAATVLLNVADLTQPLSQAKKWVMRRDMMSSFTDKTSPEAELIAKAVVRVITHLLDAGCRDHRLLAPLLYRGQQGFEEILATAVADFYENKPGSVEGLTMVKVALAAGNRILAANPKATASMTGSMLASGHFPPAPGNNEASSSSHLPTKSMSKTS